MQIDSSTVTIYVCPDLGDKDSVLVTLAEAQGLQDAKIQEFAIPWPFTISGHHGYRAGRLDISDAGCYR